MEVHGELEVVVFPNFKAQKVFAGGKDVALWAQVRRRTALVIAVTPVEDPQQQYRKHESWGIVRFFDSDDQYLEAYVGATPKAFFLGRQCTRVTITTHSGGVAWLADPHTLRSIPND